MPKILLVEDNPAIMDFYMDFFGDFGFEIQSAEDALTAIAKQQQFAAQVVLLDLNIPNGGGMHVYQTLRGRGDMVPVIFSTGKPETLPDTAQMQNVAVVCKPTPPEKLMSEVQRMLQAAAGPAMNPPPPPPPPPVR